MTCTRDKRKPTHTAKITLSFYSLRDSLPFSSDRVVVVGAVIPKILTPVRVYAWLWGTSAHIYAIRATTDQLRYSRPLAPCASSRVPLSDTAHFRHKHPPNATKTEPFNPHTPKQQKQPNPVLQHGLREWLLHHAPSVLQPTGRVVVQCDGKWTYIPNQ